MRLIAISSFVLSTVLIAGAASAQPKRARSSAPAFNPAPAAPAVAEATKAPELDRNSEIRRGLKFESFFDLEARIPNKDWVADRGVTVNDGALYVSKDFNRGLSALVDLPFYSVLTTGTNQFAFAQGKAQAYFLMNRAPLILKAGQYDTFFGIEENDSRDRFFADSGFVDNFITPQTHTGGQVAFVVSNVTLRGIVGNPSDSTAMGNRNPEFGGQARFDANNVFGAFGLTVQEGKNIPTGNKTNMLVDVMGGVNVDRLRLEGAFDIKKTQGEDKTANSLMALGTYQMTDAVGIGARFEYLKDFIASIANTNGIFESAITLAGGATYKFEQDILLRGDVSFANIKPGQPGTSDETVVAVTGSLVVSL